VTETITIEQTSRAVVTVRFEGVAAGWEQWILLRSDAHHDSPKCDRKLEAAHLQMMADKEGLWADFGDLFDAMQGKHDPRRDYDEIRPEDLGTDYYDRIVKHAAEFYAPFAERCIVLGVGGHETATEHNCGMNLTGNLILRLHDTMTEFNYHRIPLGGFGGWIRLLFHINGTKRKQLKLRYFHGAGGGAPVTKGIIDTARQAVYLPDANIIVNGHNHEGYVVPLRRQRLNERGTLYDDIQWHGRVPGYKCDWDTGVKGWAVEKGHGPKPKGALWLHLSCEGDSVGYKLIPEMV